MEQFNITTEQLDSIKSQIESIIEILNSNEMYYDSGVLEDILKEGAGGIVFHHEIDLWKFPEGLEKACDKVYSDVVDFIPDFLLMNEFIVVFLEKNQF